MSDTDKNINPFTPPPANTSPPPLPAAISNTLAEASQNRLDSNTVYHNPFTPPPANTAPPPLPEKTEGPNGRPVFFVNKEDEQRYKSIASVGNETIPKGSEVIGVRPGETVAFPISPLNGGFSTKFLTSPGLKSSKSDGNTCWVEREHNLRSRLTAACCGLEVL